MACLLPLFVCCGRRPQAEGIERLAVLRFENLGADPGTDWMGRALAEILTSELAAAPGTYAMSASRLHALGRVLGPRPLGAPGISAEAPLAIAAGANRIAYGQYYVEAGTLHASLTLTDPRTSRTVRVIGPVTAPDSGVEAAATALARQLWPQAQPYPVRNIAALEAFAGAMEAADAKGQEAEARQALAADPDFGPAYLLLADLKARENDAGGLRQVLDTASARGNALAAADRARLELLSAGVSGDRSARVRALSELARLIPNDPTTWRALAEFSTARHEYAAAVQAYRRALAIEPDDTNSWNQLGYTAASAGNLPAGMAALGRYRQLRPSDPNPLDSIGDINFISGRFQEARQAYLQAGKMSPGFLNGADYYKAAMACLMTGDIAGADALYDQFPAHDQLRAEWLRISGRRSQAYAALTARIAQQPPAAQSNGYAELAIWYLLDGDRAAADRAAVSTAPTGLGALARFLLLPNTQPAEWAARAQQVFRGPAAAAAPHPSDIALAYALLLNGQFQPAAEVLRRSYDASGAAPDADTPVELAWALAETGDLQNAGALLRLNPVPSAAGPSPLLGFWFPRLFQLRAQVAEKAGKAEEARTNQHLFQLLSAR